MDRFSLRKMEIIVLGNEEADHVSIQVNGWSEDWAGAEIEVWCDGWKGRFRGSFYKGELSRFAREITQIYQTLLGTASLSPLEPNIKLALCADGKGHVTVNGTATVNFTSDTYLTFCFEIDQTYLSRVAAALSAADPY